MFMDIFTGELLTKDEMILKAKEEYGVIDVYDGRSIFGYFIEIEDE